jgi:hypothetical protein
MLELNYDYDTCVRNSEKVAWTLDDVFPPDTKLDFNRPFLPAALAGDRAISELSTRERLLLNQITGHAYINLFAFLEECIIVTAVRHAEAEMHGNHSAMRALLRFADEEIKHQDLFHRYMHAFADGFASPCKVIDNAVEVAGLILSKTPIAILMITLHFEIMTQAHYTESVRPENDLDPLFASLLEHHWLEEAQHARIDALELDKFASLATPALLQLAFEQYISLTDVVSALLEAQARLDVESLERAASKTYAEPLREKIADRQYHAYRNTFLVSGMENKQFVDIVRTLSPEGARGIADKAASFK